MKSIAIAIVVLGVCAGLSLAVSPTDSCQSISSTNLNSTAVKVFSAANQTDAAIWNANALTTGAADTGVHYSYVYFGPGTANTTAYVYGVVAPAGTPLVFSKIYKRTLNATVVGWGNDTTMQSVSATDGTITLTTPATAFLTAVAPGYLAVLSYGTASSNEQIYVNLVKDTSATQYAITTNADVAASTCTGTSNTATTVTTVGLGNIWYDMGAGAFLFTYWKQVVSTPCTAGSPGTPITTTNTIHLGGLYTNGTAYYTNPGLSFTTAVAANAVTYLRAGGDNWSNAANIFVVYRDNTGAKTYYSKIAKNATAGGSFTALNTDDATANAAKKYYPVGVWASDYTYGISVAVENQTAAAVWNYPILNYLNGSTTGVDSGLSYSGVTTTAAGNAATGVWGWKLSTGYTLLASWPSSTATTPATSVYVLGSFQANGTANGTQVTLASLQGPLSVYSDVNGTMWVGYTDIDTANSKTYAGWLAKLQGQINAASSSNGVKLIAITWAVVAFVFAALF